MYLRYAAPKPLPPAKVEYVEKQPTLEDIFFAVVGNNGSGKDGSGSTPGNDGTDTSRTAKEAR